MNAKKIRVSQDRKKMIDYVNNRIAEGPYKTDIIKLRSEYKIPSNGYDTKAETVWNTDITNILSLPKKWPYLGNKKRFKELGAGIEKIRAKHLLENDFWSILLANYLFFNIIDTSMVELSTDGLCIISTPEGRKYSPNFKLKNYKKKIEKWFPISIHISPYASLNDIVDYVRLNADSIKRCQDKYKNNKILIGKVRGRFTYKRDKFILEHKHLPRARISELLRKKLNIEVDKMYIRNIISKELRKQRNK